MLSLLATLALSQICLMDEGNLKACNVKTINCSGAGVTCSIVNQKGVVTVSTGGSAPTDATYITQTPNATLTNEQALSANATGLMISTTATGVVSSYAGATCAADNYASAASAVGALTCSIPPGTCSGGDEATADMQYNGNGTCGGCTNFECDGTRPRIVGETSHPSTPGTTDTSLIYDYLVTTRMPVQKMHIDNAMGIPTPEGLLNLFSLNGPTSNWRVSGCMPIGFQSTTYSEIGDVTLSATCSNGGSCTVTGPTWSSVDFYGRSPVVLHTKTAAAGANVMCGTMYTGNPSVHFWRGSCAGCGGFFWWARIYIVTKYNDGMSVGKMFAGIMPMTGTPSASAQPSSYVNSAYFGHDTNSGAVTNLNFCTNDGTGTATCADLGSNFPSEGGAMYDLYIWSPPNGSSVYGAAVLLDPSRNSGLLDANTNIPVNTVQMTWATLLGSANDDAGPTAIAFGGALTAWNY